MAYNTKKMLEDSNGDLIPQYWDVVDQEFKPLTGKDGAQDTRLTGSIDELAVELNMTVAAGSSGTFTTIAELDYKEIIMSVRTGSAHGFRSIAYWRYPGATYSPVITSEDLFSVTNANNGTGSLKVRMKEVRILISNESQIDRNYDLFLYGVK